MINARVRLLTSLATFVALAATALAAPTRIDNEVLTMVVPDGWEVTNEVISLGKPDDLGDDFFQIVAAKEGVQIFMLEYGYGADDSAKSNIRNLWNEAEQTGAEKGIEQRFGKHLASGIEVTGNDQTNFAQAAAYLLYDYRCFVSISLTAPKSDPDVDRSWSALASSLSFKHGHNRAFNLTKEFDGSARVRMMEIAESAPSNLPERLAPLIRPWAPVFDMNPREEKSWPRKMIFVGDKFALVSLSSILVSPDGRNWTEYESPSLFMPRWYFERNGEIEGWISTYMLKSHDLISWESIPTHPGLIAPLYHDAFLVDYDPRAGYLFFNKDESVATRNLKDFKYSKDLAKPQPGNINIDAIDYFDGAWYGAGSFFDVATGKKHASIWRTANGEKWDQIYMDDDPSGFKMLISNDAYLAVAKESGDILVTHNGTDWTPSELKTKYYGDGALKPLPMWIEAGYLIACSGNNRLVFSENGVERTAGMTVTETPIISLAYGDNRFAAYTKNGIFLSPELGGTPPPSTSAASTPAQAPEPKEETRRDGGISHKEKMRLWTITSQIPIDGISPKGIMVDGKLIRIGRTLEAGGETFTLVSTHGDYCKLMTADKIIVPVKM